MKVGIVTITELDNFGNRLQNYALQNKLQEMGCQVETIPNYICYKKRKTLFYKLMECVKGILKRDSKRIAAVYKQIRFDSFDKKYFDFSEEYSTIDYIDNKLNEKFDCFVAGSDQIWNPYFPFNFDFNFLNFADKEKRIAYAASFGVSEIPNSKQKMFKDYLNQMSYISVREISGKEIVSKITGKDVPVLLDPTLLLTKKQWENIEKKPSWVKAGKYALLYYLGENIENRAYDKLDIQFDNIINLSDGKKMKVYASTPDEFVWLIHHAEVMVTDSFHGCVFSLLMETPLLYLERKDNEVSMNSRVTTLFKHFNIEYSGDIIRSHIKNNEILDVLDKKRSEAELYLKNALNLNREGLN